MFTDPRNQAVEDVQDGVTPETTGFTKRELQAVLAGSLPNSEEVIESLGFDPSRQGEGTEPVSNATLQAVLEGIAQLYAEAE